jgi:hypothetical protein
MPAMIGEYALVANHVLTDLGLSKMQNVTCYSRGAAIYQFREGTINIVRLGPPRKFVGVFADNLSAVEVLAPAALQAEVTKVLAGYSNITAPWASPNFSERRTSTAAAGTGAVTPGRVLVRPGARGERGLVA